MVSRHEVPRMQELIPIMLRLKPDGYELLIAHNARRFDVLDSLSLAHELVKAQGLKPPTKLKLQALGEYFQAPVSGTAHREGGKFRCKKIQASFAGESGREIAAFTKEVRTLVSKRMRWAELQMEVLGLFMASKASKVIINFLDDD